MKPKKIAVFALIVSLVVVGGFFGYGVLFPAQEASEQQVRFSSYLDIPNITETEINAIEQLREKFDYFTYGMMFGKDAFLNEKGELSGYSVNLADWLSELFGIEFRVKHYNWSDLVKGHETNDIHFTTTFVITDERKKTHFMTDPIVEQQLKAFRLSGALALEEIEDSRALRYGFLARSMVPGYVREAQTNVNFESVFVDSLGGARAALENGEIDVFFHNDVVEAYFDRESGFVSTVFSPLLYASVGLSTREPELAVIISVVQKAIESGARIQLNELYTKGYNDYLKHKLNLSLNSQEREYLETARNIRYLADNHNYPVSFYDERIEQWQGIAIDLLEEIAELTALKFAILNQPHESREELYEKLESGKALMITELFKSPTLEERFIYPESTYINDDFVLVSKHDRPNIHFNDILSIKIGLIKDTVCTDAFKKWFPTREQNIKEYDKPNDAYRALEKGEVDMIMSSRNHLLFPSNYLDQSDFKINVVFDYDYNATFGFNKDETILCSIVDKAMALVNIDLITKQWETKTYDDQIKQARLTIPWIAGGTAVLAAVVLILFIFLKKADNKSKKLEGTIAGLEKKLTMQTNTFDSMINAIPDLVFCLDSEFKFTKVNKAFELYFGNKEDSFIGETTATSGFPPELIQKINKIDRRVISERHTFSSEEELPTIGGNKTFFETTKAPLLLDGKVVGLIGISRDISVRKAVEEELRLASLSKSAFLAHMSHEIRTPMNSIIGFAELALDDEISERTQDYLSKIMENSTWLLQIINDILDISKIESGKMELDKVHFTLSEMFESCQAIIQPKAIERGLELYFYAEHLLSQPLLGDSLRLRQVLVNILSNAVKFTHEGSIKLYATVTNSDVVEAGICRVMFEIKDTGIGMSSAQLEKVFAPFSQADSGTTRKYGGTGLGLPITKNIIELMGGWLEVNSEPGVGSTFKFEMPFELAATSSSNKGVENNPLKVKHIERPLFSSEVLVCEDNPMNRRVISEHLSRLGIIPTMAQNGKEGVHFALERAKTGNPFDLILMDIHMPIMDGIEATKTLKQSKIKTPVVALTANIMKNDQRRYKECGMKGFLGKPFTSQALWQCLLEYLKPIKTLTVSNEPNVSEIDEKLLKELSMDFLKANRKKFEEIEIAIAAGDIDSAHRLAHTLKSTSALIKKMKLSLVAADVEKTLREKQRPTTAQMEALKVEIVHVLDELQLSQQAENPTADPQDKEGVTSDTPMSTERAEEILDLVFPLLKSGNPECLNFIEEIKEIPGSRRLVIQMEDFDFQAAVGTLNEMRGRGE
ncbi:MAG: transporter substrate-binding domain-containing protein [Oscillospiraceae bacterium]|nr:transporter substrate-binding domain-containing protein [Oscillospiraceae bacterium]